ncbi:type II secretion system F family protein [Nocardiopsis sp. HUAS JQ3]|uniref:type II secretion system F family protein n=1 Tax=Nocardiopsis sp. HUAS JQ3 TaxID=3061629 RepID=UPI0023A9FE81|nr:type II secretion system F family protein [Nocardiopsis sp. HUAS JQ3]WDZ92829.1 type II secretion system F family protein [Nocardiopsis sp. HUAS JQ3]
MTAALVLGGAGGLLLGAGAWLLLTGVQHLPRNAGARVRRTPMPRARVLRAASTVAGGVLIALLTGWPVAGLLAAAGMWWLPRLLGPDREHASSVAQVDAVAGWAEQIRDLMAGAAGLHQAIAHTVPTAPEPIRADVAHLAEQLQRGTPPEEALREFAVRVQVPTADLVVAALSSVASRHAADLGALLSSLAQAAREQAAMLVRIAATRARVRTSARIIAATTLALAVGLALVNADYLAPYNTGIGQLVLAGIGALWAVGLVWLARLTRTSLGPRVLAREKAEPEVVL